MSVTEQAEGLVLDKGGVRWFDTQAMPWEPMPGLPGYFRKVLAVDDGEPSVMLNYIPSGLLGKQVPVELPYRHLHRTTREFALVLHGELISWEYESPDQLKGDLVRKGPGYFMDRKPGSIHGVEASEPFSITGAILLTWREGGPGVWFGERGFETETVKVPYEAGAGFTPGADEPHEAGDACIRNRGGVTWLDTNRMQWEPMPFLPAVDGYFFHKVLVRDDKGEPIVRLNTLPPAELLTGKLPYRSAGTNLHQRAFMLWGEFGSWEYETPEPVDGVFVHKKTGFFQDRQPGSLHGTQPPGALSRSGAVWINWLGPN
jgi:hypothetical protein